MCSYYDGTKLLYLTDLDGKQPEILMVTTNRTGGKTTYFGRLCVNKFKKGQGKLRFYIDITMNWMTVLINSLKI